MRLSMPRAISRAVEETVGGYAFTRDWSKYLRDLWTVLGFDYKTPMYSGLPLELVEVPAAATIDGAVKAPELATGSSTAVCKAGKLPETWQAETGLEPFIEWSRATGASGDVILSLGYAIGGVGDTIDTETEEQLSAITVSDAGVLVRTTFTVISGAALEKGDSCLFAFSRKGALAGDTFGGSVYVHACGVRVKVEGIGHEKVHP